MSRHLRYLAHAQAVAMASPHPRWFLGAVLVRGSSVISAAQNVRKNSPALMDGAPGTSTHAEVNAIRKVFRQADRAEGCTLYIARVNNQGLPRLARPCDACYRVIMGAGIKSIVYSVDSLEDYGIERIIRHAS